MFVDNDFFDNEDDDNKLKMDASPYTNGTVQKTATVQSNTFGRPQSIKKEFDVNGDVSYASTRRDDQEDTNQFISKENSRKKQVITFKSRGQVSRTQNPNFEDSQKSETQTISRTEPQKSQKPAFNEDMEFTDLGDSNSLTSKSTLPKSNWDPHVESVGFNNQFEARDQTELSRPGTSTNSDLRQKGIIQSKQRLLDQNRMQFSGAGTFQSNDTLTNKNQNNQGPLYYKNEETKDYNELAKYAYDGKKEFYDPSMKKSDKAQFSLSKMQQNIKYERNEDYIPPARDDIQVKDLTPYKEEKNEPEEDSEKEAEEKDGDNEDDQLAAKRFAEEVEKKKLAEKEFAKQAGTKEAKVELIAKPQIITEESPSRELRLLDPEYLDTVDMKTFLTRPSPKNYLIQCNIKREKATFGFYPKYFVSLSNGFRFLLAAKKCAGNASSNYTVSMNAKDFSTKSRNFIGKVRSNFLGTEFNIWDNGVKAGQAKSLDALREQLAVVLYERNILGSKGPRKMHVLLPDVKPNGELYKFKPTSAKEGMLQNYNMKRMEGFKEYYNKPPRWNEHYQAFVLNFNGRVEKPSVKNFQLVHESNEDTILLQFGRTNKDTFTMDFQWPLSPLQAFSICLTSFDYKLACE